MLLVWFAIALAAAIVEASTTALVSVWFTVGALAAAGATKLGFGIGIQITVFLVVSLVLFACFLLFFKKRRKAFVPTNADRLIGCDGIVQKPIDPITASGEVMVNGQVWTAQTEDGQSAETGELVRVLKIEGAHLIVQKKSKESVES